MRKLREELKQLLLEGKYEFLGIRGMESWEYEKLKEEYEIGNILDTSYLWDYERDVSSYDTDSPIELGGVCAVDLVFGIYYDYNLDLVDEETMDEILDDMIERVHYAINEYKFSHYWIIGSNNHNPYNMEENDPHEIILADAEVLLRVK